MEKSILVVEQDVRDETALGQFGYQQELERSFSFLGMLGFSFNIVSCWGALAGILIVGAQLGGPPVMIWSWIGISIVTLPIAYSMAEMCSAYPVAGGQYSWAGLLAPKQFSRGFSYICGWFMLVGIIGVGATNNFIQANFILGLANLTFPEYTIQRWHTVLVAYATTILGFCFNIFASRLFEKISRGLLVWNIGSFVIIVTTLLATNRHKQSASFVFYDFVNYSGFNPAYTSVLGLLFTAFGMCCYDAPAHMVEELRNARRDAPRAIIFSVYIGAVTGFGFLVAACFCIGSIETTAKSSTGVPIIQIFYDSTSSVAAAICLSSLGIVLGFGASNALTAEGARAVYAFARDGGLPFSNLWSRVNSVRSLPIPALCLVFVVQIALESIYLGSATGFQTVISITTEGFYVSYALPLLARLVALLLPSSRSHALHAMRSAGGLYDLGKLSIPFNIIGFLFLGFLTVTFNLPSVYPVTSSNMNYTSAAIGGVMVLAGLTWVTTARKSFRGPESIRQRGEVTDVLEHIVVTGRTAEDHKRSELVGQ